MAGTEPKKDEGLRSDAWARFERAVDVVAKSPPQHRIKSAKKAAKRRPKRDASPSKP